MTPENKKRLKNALSTASELIRGHGEVGLSPEDVGEKDQKGLDEYIKATGRAAKMITTLANKY